MNIDPAMFRRVRAALRDAEAWTAKWIADNDHDVVEPGMPLNAGKAALRRISSVRSEIEEMSAHLQSKNPL